MPWNWQLSDWPKFTYEASRISLKEKQFLLGSGSSFAFLKNVGKEERLQFMVEILSLEGMQSSKIEGEILERESLQSSIRQHFGLKTETKRAGKKELGIARLLCDLYETFDQPLTHEMLWRWYGMLFDEPSVKQYRMHEEPMQIVSGRFDQSKVFFEAPPSKKVFDEMSAFIEWFNSSLSTESPLAKSAIAHVYFESIHPFEDGNGRIGRALAEKILSQSLGKPVLIAVSKFIEKQKKKYYEELGKCNHSLQASDWVEFFAGTILEAQEDAMLFLQFLMAKSKMLTAFARQINPRQEKVLLRMFAEGVNGFKGGLSAENYISITKGSRATATRDLLDLVEKGALVKTGELRHTRYFLNLKKFE